MIELTERMSALAVLRAPVTVLVGHFGSGKTEIALNLEFAIRESGSDVTLVDLDLVKPYFRSRLAREELAAASIGLVVPPGELIFADLPILVPMVGGAVATASVAHRLVIDVGGDDTGARVLGAVKALTPGQAEALFVVNVRRPFAGSRDEIVTMMREIEAASHLPISGLIANTHLIEETTPDVVLEGIRMARELEQVTGIGLRFCAVLDRLAAGIGSVATNGCTCPILPLTRRIVPFPTGRGPSRRRAVVV